MIKLIILGTLLTLINSSDPTECLEQMQHILTPQGVSSLLSTILNSGKFITDLGNYEGCNSDQNLIYALLRTYYFNALPVVSLGFCAPSKCSDPEYYVGISKYVDKIVGENTPYKGTTTSVMFPSLQEPEPLSPGAYISFSLYGLLILLAITASIFTAL